MYLEHVTVRGFKSVEDAAVEFSPGFNAIFGENGTGKSNLVQAILKLLGPTYPGPNSFSANDHFKRDEGREIEIVLIFNEGGSHKTLRWGPVGAGRQRLTLDGASVTDAARDRYRPIYFPTSREVRELPGANAWNPLGRIISELADRLKSDLNLRAGFDAKATELNAILEQSPDYARFKTKLREYATEHLGSRGRGLDLQLKLVDPENALRTLQVFEEQSGSSYNASASGLGVQSGITMAALRAFADVAGGRFFIIADEPESFLHPLSQEALRAVFEKLFVAGTQVIVTTHSPHFVSSKSLEGLHKVWMDGGATQVLQYGFQDHVNLMQASGITGVDGASISGRLSQHLTIEAREGLFAKTVVLCEGDTEAGSLGVWATMKSIDFPTEGIALVPAHGKMSMPTLAFFYKTLRIPTYIVFDSDSRKTGADRRKHAETNRLLLRIEGASEVDFPPGGVHVSYAVFSPDFEDSVRNADAQYSVKEAEVDDQLGLRPDGSKGIRARHVALRYQTEGLVVPQPICELIDGIKSFHEAAGSSAVLSAPATPPPSP